MLLRANVRSAVRVITGEAGETFALSLCFCGKLLNAVPVSCPAAKPSRLNSNTYRHEKGGMV